MEHYELSDVGRRREQNQDSFGVCTDSKYPVFVLCDGMGGHRAGEVASSEAVKDIVQTLEELINEDDGNVFVKIISAVSHANRRLYSMALRDESYSGMGTTCDVCVVTGDGACIGHVGDSRVYIFTESGLFQITRDHSVVEEMIRRGELNPGEANTYEHMITRALGPDSSVQTDTFLVAFKPGDIILMCSDGLTNMVAEIDIAYILSKPGSLEEKAKRLVELANDNGGQDNITVILIRK